MKYEDKTGKLQSEVRLEDLPTIIQRVICRTSSEFVEKIVKVAIAQEYSHISTLQFWSDTASLHKQKRDGFYGWIDFGPPVGHIDFRIHTLKITEVATSADWFIFGLDKDYKIEDVLDVMYKRVYDRLFELGFYIYG